MDRTWKELQQYVADWLKYIDNVISLMARLEKGLESMPAYVPEETYNNLESERKSIKYYTTVFRLKRHILSTQKVVAAVPSHQEAGVEYKYFDKKRLIWYLQALTNRLWNLLHTVEDLNAAILQIHRARKCADCVEELVVRTGMGGDIERADLDFVEAKNILGKSCPWKRDEVRVCGYYPCKYIPPWPGDYDPEDFSFKRPYEEVFGEPEYDD